MIVYKYIYKILSPTGKIYIGQTKDIKERKRAYSEVKCKKQPLIYNSLKCYGWKKHKWDIILKVDTRVLDIDTVEKFFIKYYNSYYHDNKQYGMNLTRGGNDYDGVYISPESKKKLSDKLKGRKKGPMSSLCRNKLSISAKNSYIEGRVHPMKGKTHTLEARLKISEKNKGKQLSEEEKRKISLRFKGKPSHRKGKKMNNESRIRMSLSHIGKQHSQETIDKIRTTWDNKKKKGYKPVPILKSKESYQKAVETRRKREWHSIDTRKNITKALSKNPVIQLSIDGLYIKEWLSSQEIDRTGIAHGTLVRKCCKNKCKTAGGYKWVYKREYEGKESVKYEII